MPLDPQVVAAGQQTFRHDTFGDETFWTDVLQMNKVIETAVDPLTAASVGLKIDADVLPANVVQGIQDGTIPLDDPQTTLALLSLDAVVGAKGEVHPGTDGKLVLQRFGITCALCHSTVSKDVHVLAGGKTDLAGIVGHRLDGWPNRDLQPGTIISLSPALTKKQAAEYASWATLFGPGFYDPRINVNIDPGSNPAVGPDIDANLAAYKAAGGIPVVIPPAYGLIGLDKAIFTGDGDTAHEPAGPVSYWNRYVGVVQMHGHGTFFDERLIINGKPLNVDHRVGDDLITPILPQLEAYQWSIAAPSLAQDGAKWGVASDLNTDAVSSRQGRVRRPSTLRDLPQWAVVHGCEHFRLAPGQRQRGSRQELHQILGHEAMAYHTAQGHLATPAVFPRRLGRVQCQDRQVHGWIRHRQPGGCNRPREAGSGVRGESVQRSGRTQPWVERRPTHRSRGIPEVALITMEY